MYVRGSSSEVAGAAAVSGGGNLAQWSTLVIVGPSLIEAAIDRRPLKNEGCFFLAKKSLGTVHLIARVHPKMIKLFMYFKLAICAMTDFLKVSKMPVLVPKIF